MSNIISRQQRRLREKGLSDDQAKWLAFYSQRLRGNTEGSSFGLSEQGQRYSSLGPLDRAILRRSQKEGRPTSAYTIKNNRVVLKK